jgi:hypothetical protein
MLMPKFVKAEHTATVLALDPGSKNMGIAVVEVNLVTGKVDVLANAVMEHPVNSLLPEDLKSQVQAFLTELGTWVGIYRPDAIVAERFQSRGLKGTLTECVNIMLGLILGTYPQIQTRLLTASTWKNRFQKRHAIKLDGLYKTIRTAPHQLDACLIGLWALEQGSGAFDYTLDWLLPTVEATSLNKLKRKKVSK